MGQSWGPNPAHRGTGLDWWDLIGGCAYCGYLFRNVVHCHKINQRDEGFCISFLFHLIFPLYTQGASTYNLLNQRCLVPLLDINGATVKDYCVYCSQRKEIYSTWAGCLCCMFQRKIKNRLYLLSLSEMVSNGSGWMQQPPSGVCSKTNFLLCKLTSKIMRHLGSGPQSGNGLIIIILEQSFYCNMQ